jgi:hypothetical protein
MSTVLRPFRGGVHGRGQTGRSRPIDRDVVLPPLGRGDETKPVGNLPQCGGEEARTVGQFDDGQIHLLEVRLAQLAAAVFIGREFDPLELDDAALEEVANLPGAGIVAMPEESNDPHLGVAVADLVSHAIFPRACRDLQEAHRRPSATP